MTSELDKRKPRKDVARPGFERAQFINYDLSKADREGFKQFREQHADEIGVFIDNLLDAGYSVSIKRDTYNECYAAYLQTSDPKSQNHGYILTGRSRSGAMAFLSLVFRHFVLFEGQWPCDTARRNPLDDE